jgi:hypothetical protein
MYIQKNNQPPILSGKNIDDQILPDNIQTSPDGNRN